MSEAMSEAMSEVMTDSVIACRGLRKIYQQGKVEVPVLLNIDFEITRGDRVAIVGASGSGKSTLLHLLGGLDQATAGDIFILGKNIRTQSEAERGATRNQALGFVYQFHHLLPEFTALENVAMPLLIGGESVKNAQIRATELLKRVGLGHRIEHKPGELSGGERQRAAVARALINKPALVLADEPTGNLDSKTAESVYQLMLELNQELQVSFLVVTHDHDLAAKLGKVLHMEDGVILS